MARPRKDKSLKVKRREISATDAEWDAIRNEAAEAGISLSRYLLERRAASPARVSTEIIIFQIEATMDIRDHVIQIADRLAEPKALLPHFLVLELMGIERQLAALTRGAGPT